MPLLELSEKKLTKKELDEKEALREKLQKGLSGEEMLMEDWEKIDKNADFFLQQEISLSILDQYWDTLLPSQRKMICQNLSIEITEEFVDRHSYTLDFEALTQRENLLTESFFNKYGERLNWEYLGQNPGLIPDIAQEKYPKLVEYAEKGYPLFAIKILKNLTEANEDIVAVGGNALYNIEAIEAKVDTLVLEFNKVGDYINNKLPEQLESKIELVNQFQTFIKKETQSIAEKTEQLAKLMVEKIITKTEELNNRIFEIKRDDLENGSDRRVSNETQDIADTSKASSSETPLKNNINNALENPEENIGFLNNFSSIIPFQNMKTRLFATYFVSGKEHLINWNEMSKEKLPMSFIKKYQDRSDFDVMEALTNNDYSKHDINKFDWNSVELSKIDNGIFIRKYGDKLDLSNFNWDQIQNIEEIGADWFEIHSEMINAEQFAGFENITVDIVDALSTDPEFANNFDYVNYFNTHDISSDFIDNHANDLDWNLLSGSPKLTQDIIDKHFDRLNPMIVVNNSTLSPETRQQFQPMVTAINDAQIKFLASQSEYKYATEYAGAVIDAFNQGIDVTPILNKESLYTSNQINVIAKGIKEGFSQEQLAILAEHGDTEQKAKILFEAIKDGINVENINLSNEFSADRLQEAIDLHLGTFESQGIINDEIREVYTEYYSEGYSTKQSSFIANNYEALENLTSLKDYSVPQLEQYLIAKEIDGINLNELMNSNLNADQMALYINLASKGLLNEEYNVDYITSLSDRKLTALNDSFDERKFKPQMLDANALSIETELSKRNFIGKLFNNLSSSRERANKLGASFIAAVTSIISEKTPEMRRKETEAKEETQKAEETVKKEEEVRTESINQTERTAEVKSQEEAKVKEEETIKEEKVAEEAIEETEAIEAIFEEQDREEFEEKLDEIAEEVKSPQESQIETESFEKEVEASAKEPETIYTEPEEIGEDVEPETIEQDTFKTEPVVDVVNPEIIEDVTPVIDDTQTFDDIVNTAAQSARSNTDAMTPTETRDLKWATEVVKGTIISNTEFLNLYDNGQLKDKLLEDKRQLQEVKDFIMNNPLYASRVDLRTLNALINEKEGQLRTLGVVEKMNPIEEVEMPEEEVEVDVPLSDKFIELKIDDKKEKVYILDENEGILSYKGVEFQVKDGSFVGINSEDPEASEKITDALENLDIIVNELDSYKPLTAQKIVDVLTQSSAFGNNIKIAPYKNDPNSFYINTNGKYGPSLLVTPTSITASGLKEASPQAKRECREIAKLFSHALEVSDMSALQEQIPAVVATLLLTESIKNLPSFNTGLPIQMTANSDKEFVFTNGDATLRLDIGENDKVNFRLTDNSNKRIDVPKEDVKLIGKIKSALSTCAPQLMEVNPFEQIKDEQEIDVQVEPEMDTEDKVVETEVINSEESILDEDKVEDISDSTLSEPEEIIETEVATEEATTEVAEDTVEEVATEVIETEEIDKIDSEFDIEEFVTEPIEEEIIEETAVESSIEADIITEELDNDFDKEAITNEASVDIVDNSTNSILDDIEEDIFDVVDITETDALPDEQSSKKDKEKVVDKEKEVFVSEQTEQTAQTPKETIQKPIKTVPFDKKKAEKVLRNMPYINAEGKEQSPSEFFKLLKDKCRNLTAKEKSTQNVGSTHGMFKLDNPNVVVTNSTISINGKSPSDKSNYMFTFDGKTNELISAKINGKEVNDLSQLPTNYQNDAIDFSNFLSTHGIEKNMLIATVIQSELLAQLATQMPEQFAGILDSENLKIETTSKDGQGHLILSNSTLSIEISQDGTILSGGDNLTPETKAVVSEFMKNNSELLFEGAKELEARKEPQKTMSQDTKELLVNAQASTVVSKVEEIRALSLKIAKEVIEDYSKKHKNVTLEYANAKARGASNHLNDIRIAFQERVAQEMTNDWILPSSNHGALAFIPDASFSIGPPEGQSKYTIIAAEGCSVREASNVNNISNLTLSDFDKEIASDKFATKNGKAPKLEMSVEANIHEVVDKYTMGQDQLIEAATRTQKDVQTIDALSRNNSDAR